MKGIKIEGFSNYWIFPELGMIWSNPRKGKDGRVVKGGWIGSKRKADGYWQVSLVPDDKGKPYVDVLHRVIWTTVYGDIPEGYEINHKSERKDENFISNLELVDRKTNNSYGTRLQRCAERLTNRQDQSIQVEQLDLDDNVKQIFSSINEAARYLNADKSCIIRCCKGKQRTHKGYKWRYIN